MSEQYFTRPNVQPVITNIGTTPEQRQMSTSEFKAKFDEMPEAIQQYIKETLLTELDAFKQEFMTHQADFEYETESKTNVGIADGTFTLEKNKYWWKVFLHNVKLSNSANANKAYKIADLTNSYAYTAKTFPFTIFSQYGEVKGIGVGYIYYNSISIIPNVNILTTDIIRARAMTMVDDE